MPGPAPLCRHMPDMPRPPARPLWPAPHRPRPAPPCPALPAPPLQKKEFPYNLEQSLFGRELNIPKGPERKAAILRVALQQLLACLEKCHAVGAWAGEGRGGERCFALRVLFGWRQPAAAHVPGK